jgi:hypothetical protein
MFNPPSMIMLLYDINSSLMASIKIGTSLTLFAFHSGVLQLCHSFLSSQYGCRSLSNFLLAVLFVTGGANAADAEDPYDLSFYTKGAAIGDS